MIYRHPDHGAAVAIERRGDVVLLDFLARGTSQKRVRGKVVGSTPRNPDRLALVEHVLQSLPLQVALALGAAGGKGAPFARLDRVVAHSDVRASYRRAGNYRWRLYLRVVGLPRAWGPSTVAELLGLVPCPEHRPVTTEWPTGLETT